LLYEFLGHIWRRRPRNNWPLHHSIQASPSNGPFLIGFAISAHALGVAGEKSLQRKNCELTTEYEGCNPNSLRPSMWCIAHMSLNACLYFTQELLDNKYKIQNSVAPYTLYIKTETEKV